MEETLVRRMQAGDESAFDEIMKELFDKLVFFIDRYVKDIQSAEDIAIDDNRSANYIINKIIRTALEIITFLFSILFSSFHDLIFFIKTPHNIFYAKILLYNTGD